MAKRTRRGRTPLPEGERKDRLIQTRVAEDLDEALRREARRNRVTVSQLIRNVLEDAFHLVDNIVVGAANLTETVRRDAQRIAASAQGRERARKGLVDRIEAWQDVVAGKPAECTRCEAAIKKGTRALLGADPADPSVRAWLCPTCAASLG